MNESSNIFAHIPSALPEELFETIAEKGATRIERIVSHGQATPEGTWYDQTWDEWVLLLKGRAVLLIGNEERSYSLNPGDHIMIPARCPHRVAWTDPAETTVWLAVHIG